MRLQQIIFQGLFDCRTPVRLDANDAYDTVQLPPGVRATDIQDLLISVVYPARTPQDLRLDYSSGADVKVAVVFEHRQRRYRLLRRSATDSMRVQVEEDAGFTNISSGDPETILQQKLGIPDYDVFWSLNLWRFDQPPPAASSVNISTLGGKVRDVVDAYRTAVRVEALEDEIKEVESLIGDTEKELGQGAALREKLEKARDRLAELEVSELSDEDLELIQTKDETLANFDHKVTRLASEEDAERNQVDLTLPEQPWRLPLFWVGLIAGVGSLAVSLIEPAEFRAVALIDIVGFGICAWILINYFSDMERASVHQVRLESIKRRLNQVREEQVALRERVNHVMIHAGVRDAKELTERVAKSEKLRGIISKMEEKIEDLRRDSDYVKAQDRLSELEEKLETLRERRSEMPESVMSAFQLETDLKDMGIDPVKVLEEDDEELDEDREEPEERTPVERLLHIAEETGQWKEDQLYDKTRKMWAKICRHVLGSKFADVEIAHRALRIGDLGEDQIKMWTETRPSEARVVLAALALALLVNAPERSRKGFFATLLIPDIREHLTGSQVKNFDAVFKSAAKKSAIILCQEDL